MAFRVDQRFMDDAARDAAAFEVGARLAGPGTSGWFPAGTFPNNPQYRQREQPFREFVIMYHDETGVPFDPVHHEAVATVERDDVAPGTVVQVVRPGYGDDLRQLRPAVVVVAKKAE